MSLQRLLKSYKQQQKMSWDAIARDLKIPRSAIEEWIYNGKIPAKPQYRTVLAEKVPGVASLFSTWAPDARSASAAPDKKLSASVQVWAVAEPFSEWLAAHPDGREAFVDHGIRPGNIDRICAGTCPDVLLAPWSEFIEQKTGLQLRELFFRQAKVDLWGSNDQLSDVETYERLLDKARGLVAKWGLNAVGKVLGSFPDTRPLSNMLRNIIRPRIGRVMRLLEMVAAERQGTFNQLEHLGHERQRATNKKAPEAPPPAIAVKAPAETFPKPSMRTDVAGITDTQRTIGDCLSLLHATVNILESATKGKVDEVLDGDRANAVRLIRRLCEAMGLDLKGLERLQEWRPITEKDTELVKLINSSGLTTRRR